MIDKLETNLCIHPDSDLSINYNFAPFNAMFKQHYFTNLWVRSTLLHMGQLFQHLFFFSGFYYDYLEQ